jgi:L-aspartate oxidase
VSEEVSQEYWNFYLTSDLIELRNIATVAGLIIECAQARQESRGLHYTIDYPDRDDANWLRDTVVWRGRPHG